MAIIFEASNFSVSGTGVDTNTTAHTIQNASGNNRLVVAEVGYENSVDTESVASVYLDGVLGTEIIFSIGGVGYSASISLWYWLDDDLPSGTGSINVVANLTDVINRGIGLAVTEFSGVAQQAPTDSGEHTSTANWNASVTVNIDSDDSLVIGAGECGGGLAGTPVNLTQLYNADTSSASIVVGYLIGATTTTETVGWNSMTTRGAFVAASFEEYAATSSSSSSSSVSSSSSLSSSSSSVSLSSSSVSLSSSSVSSSSVSSGSVSSSSVSSSSSSVSSSSKSSSSQSQLLAFIMSSSVQVSNDVDTTSQLSAPVEGNFVSGKVYTTQNPGSFKNLNANQYTEYEFCFLPGNVVSGGQYEFRLQGLSTYPLTPKLTMQ